MKMDTSLYNRVLQPGLLWLAPQVETLVTIHVHQRDVMNDLATLHRHKRISDANDFEWLKQVFRLWACGGFGASLELVFSLVDLIVAPPPPKPTSCCM